MTIMVSDAAMVTGAGSTLRVPAATGSVINFDWDGVSTVRLCSIDQSTGEPIACRTFGWGYVYLTLGRIYVSIEPYDYEDVLNEDVTSLLRRGTNTIWLILHANIPNGKAGLVNPLFLTNVNPITSNPPSVKQFAQFRIGTIGT